MPSEEQQGKEDKADSTPSTIAGVGVAVLRESLRAPTERVLTLFICVAFGYAMFSNSQSAADREIQARRSQEDAEERNRQFMAVELEKGRQGGLAIAKEVLGHCSSENDKSRNYHAAESEKIRRVITVLADEFTKIGKKLNIQPPEDNDDTNVAWYLPWAFGPSPVAVAPPPKFKGEASRRAP